jgi:hypothetical protein
MTILSASAYIFRPIPNPYIIYAGDYDDGLPATRSLHLLCHALNRAGFESYVVTGVTNPHLHTPTIQTMRRAQLSAAGRLPIVVYPGTIAGNPLEQLALVRWLLAPPGAGTEKWVGPRGLPEPVFYQEKGFLTGGLEGERLHMPQFDDFASADAESVAAFETELQRFIDITQRYATP